MFVEAQGLKPLWMLRPHHQPAGLEPQWPAMGCQLRAGDLGPGLPEGGQAGIPLPLLLELV
jgi:hypothetical protein